MVIVFKLHLKTYANLDTPFWINTVHVDTTDNFILQARLYTSY